MEPKPFSIKSPEEVASAYGGNKQKIAQAIQMGALDPTSGLLAGMFIDRMRSAQAMEQAPQQTVAQQVLAPSAPPAPPAGLGAIGPQGGAMPPAPPPPPAGLGAMPPVGMAAGGMTELPTSYGLENLPIPDSMYDEQSFAGGGIVAFADAGDVRTKRRKALMAVATDPDSSPEDRMAARAALNKLEGMGPGRTPGPGLADALAYTYEGPRGMDLLNQLDKATGAPVGGTRMDPSGYKEPPANLFRNAEAAQRGPRIMDFLNRLDEATGAPVGGTRLDPAEFNRNPPPSNLFGNAEAAQRGPRIFSDPTTLRGKTLAQIDAESRAKNEASGQVPFRGFGDTADRMAAILGDAEINTYGNAEDAQRGPRTTGSINNLGETTRTLAAQFSPPPSDPAGLNALIASNNPNVRPASDADKPYGSPNAARRAAAKVDRERGAMVAPSPSGDRGERGATRTPATTEKETTPAAGTDTPNAMTLEEIQKRIDEAGKIPDFQRTSAEELAARKNEDLWSTLAQIGFGMAAGESPNFLTNVGKATAAATPAMQEAIKERRKDTKDERNREFDYLIKKAGAKGDDLKSAYSVFNSMKDREQRLTLEQMRIDAQERENRLNREVQTRGQDITAAGQKITADYYNSLSEKDQRNVEYYANILFKAGKAKTIEEARAIVFNQLNPIPARSSTNVGSLQDRINAFGGRTGGKGGNMIDYGSLE